MIGALVNRTAVATCVQKLLDGTKLDITVIACGERWTEPSDDGALRFAVEDYLGAGAILSRINGDLSAEARICAGAFDPANAESLLFNCGSGREQIDKGDRASVLHAGMIDRYNIVPVLRDGCRLEPLTSISEIAELAQATTG
jgi:2-phosphosulfolactate phosphatase